MTPERIAELTKLAGVFGAIGQLLAAVPELLDTVERMRVLLEVLEDDVLHDAPIGRSGTTCSAKCHACAIDKELAS